MVEIVSLDEGYATTRLCHRLIPEEYLNGEGKVDPQKKFTIDIPEYGIKASAIPAKEGEKFDTLLFHPEGEGRQGEGGLRTRGYFKHSYKKVDGQWYIVDQDDKPIEPIDNKKVDSIFDKQYSAFGSLPLVTVITVVYNGEKHLKETIQSVINQDYPNIEYIVIDGGSKDGTLDIIRKYEAYIDYWVSERDEGIYDAMNKGIFLSSGDFAQFLNADDYLFSKGSIVDLLISKEKVIFSNSVYFGCAVVEKGGERWLYPSANIDNIKKWLMDGNTPNHQAMLFPKVFYKSNMYNTRYKISSDILYKNDAIENNQYVFRNVRVVVFRIGGMSTQHDNLRYILLRIRDNILMNYEKKKYVKIFSGSIKIFLKYIFSLALGNNYSNFINKIKKYSKV